MILTELTDFTAVYGLTSHSWFFQNAWGPADVVKYLINAVSVSCEDLQKKQTVGL